MSSPNGNLLSVGRTLQDGYRQLQNQAHDLYGNVRNQLQRQYTWIRENEEGTGRMCNMLCTAFFLYASYQAFFLGLGLAKAFPDQSREIRRGLKKIWTETETGKLAITLLALTAMHLAPIPLASFLYASYRYGSQET